ncbi:FAD-dependent monooxygenase [Curtobacterium sp. VKM Ac-2887]|uniref:FAD-dependent monooxygenase n=1 Tax=Curtobacterium sp. VKM Ac-2887 TaxID=2783819 RepID=UPI00188ACFA0|nr:FAD-dependent monooxygenase [Curtobacterium sp. VKM Ac-2887]MBF4588292.1 FAD-dependent monooxygenase [Curtobacterium sp. VKM Ac-2887]
MTFQRQRVLVSGASVAGLTAAYWLAKYRFEVTVVESSDGLRPGGQALDVRGPALEVARRMGVLEDLRRHTTDLLGMSMVDESGTEVYRTTERTLTGGRFESEDLEVLRDDLVAVLRTAVPDDVTFVFSDRITGISDDGPDGMQVMFEHSLTSRFDFVVGADGSHSGVRRIVFGPEKPFRKYMGDYVAVLTIPNFLELDRWQTFHMGDGGGVGIIGPSKDQDARAYLGFSSAEEVEYDYHDSDAQKRLLAERLAGTGWVAPQVLEHMWEATSFHFDARFQVLMDHWTRGRVALVGDAGYAVSLTTGQGTSIAMVGAYVLAGELASARGDLAAGARSYEVAIREYVLWNQAAARALNEQDDAGAEPGLFADFGSLVEEITLREYPVTLR